MAFRLNKLQPMLWNKTIFRIYRALISLRRDSMTYSEELYQMRAETRKILLMTMPSCYRS